MMLAIFAGKNREDWDDLLPAVTDVHESTGFSPYRLMVGEKCTLPMDIGLPKQHRIHRTQLLALMQFGFGMLYRWHMNKCDSILAK